ncbi:MAG TPA: NTF2 fold immunity protein [Chthonomonadales bacterium]|nr:NTF2 fold immunity protein [Chthonomonadales bacterium]
MKTLEVELLVPRRLTSRAEASEVLGLLENVYSGLRPEKYGHLEPIRTPFDREAVLRAWPDVFFWRHRQPSVTGCLFPKLPNRANSYLHAWITISVGLFKADVASVKRFLSAASGQLNAHFAFAHYLTEGDQALGRANRTISDNGVCVSAHTILKSIPDLYWITVLGTPYVQIFGRDRLLSAPAYRVEELENGAFLLQLSEHPLDAEKDYEAVNRVRLALKQHLDCNVFFDLANPPDHIYNVPDFGLAEKYAAQDALDAISQPALPPTPESKGTPEEIAQVQSALQEFIRRMNRWETVCWSGMQGTGEEGKTREQRQQMLRSIFEECCAANSLKGARLVTFRNPPEYNAEAEKILSVVVEGRKAVVYTKQTTGYTMNCRYYLKKVGARWLVSSKQIRDIKGEYIYALL